MFMHSMGSSLVVVYKSIAVWSDATFIYNIVQFQLRTHFCVISTTCLLDEWSFPSWMLVGHGSPTRAIQQWFCITLHTHTHTHWHDTQANINVFPQASILLATCIQLYWTRYRVLMLGTSIPIKQALYSEFILEKIHRWTGKYSRMNSQPAW